MNDTEEFIPKSRIYPLGTGEIPSGMTTTQYVEMVLNCRLKSYDKSLLMYFAHRYNFKERRPTSMSIRRAANDLDIDKKTFLKYRKHLEQLGWLEVIEGRRNGTNKVILRIGHELPDLPWKEPTAKNDQMERESEN